MLHKPRRKWPELGYDFLRNAIADNDYKARGCQIEADEIFVSDGAKCDSGPSNTVTAGPVI